MKKVKYSVRERNIIGGGSANRIRKERRVPGVIYGKGEEAIHIETDLIPIEKLFYTAGESTIIDLDVDGKNFDVLIHRVEFHPVRNEIIHIDFLKVDDNKRVTSSIPVNFVGTSPAVHLGGTLVVSKSELDVECLVKDLIHEVEADLSILKEYGDVIRLGDLNIPEGVKVMLEDSILIARVEAPKKAEEAIAAVGAEETTEEASTETTEENSAE